MQIIWCLGGLGNQMFQYAFYRRLQLGGKDVVLDLSPFENYVLHNGFELTKIFGISVNAADVNEVIAFKQKASSANVLKRICWKIFVNTSLIIVQKHFEYNQKFATMGGNKYLEGYWQSEKYFGDYSDIIRSDFIFPELDNKNQLLASEIRSSYSISLHVRMGDYVNHPLHGGICTLEYYKKAIKIIKENVKTPVFFIFSNDIEWCRSNLDIEKVVYVSGNDGENSYRDMQLMSLCKHNIIANSSFSWWGAWLNNNLKKMVIAPKKWFNDSTINVSDLLPDEWIRI